MFLFTYLTFRAESCLIIPKRCMGTLSRVLFIFLEGPLREVKTHYIYIYASFLACSPSEWGDFITALSR